jgi:hypothetical protein
MYEKADFQEYQTNYKTFHPKAYALICTDNDKC